MTLDDTPPHQRKDGAKTPARRFRRFGPRRRDVSQFDTRIFEQRHSEKFLVILLSNPARVIRPNSYGIKGYARRNVRNLAMRTQTLMTIVYDTVHPSTDLLVHAGT